MQRFVEVCTYTTADCRVAEEAGADRIELCADVSAGGTTPSPGMIEWAASLLELDTAVMIRPRGGDFCYDLDEQLVMQRDITAAGKAGAQAVVLGILTRDGHVDTEAMQPLLATAADRNLETVFHRAFDVTEDPMEALEDILNLGMTRLLTSGCAPKAVDGQEVLTKLLARAGDDLQIMAGGSVAAANAERFLQLGVRHLHTGRSINIPSPMVWGRPDISMGRAEYDDRVLRRADYQEIAQIIELAARYSI